MHPSLLSRRRLLARCGSGLGSLALADLLSREGLAAADASANPLAPQPPHFPAKAKAVIWLFMNGGPSQVDTWDYKPELAKRDGQELPGFDKDTGFFTDQVGPLMKSPFAWKQHGQMRQRGCRRSSRTWPSTSTTWPSSTRCCTESNNHSPALFMINTGMSRDGLPVRRVVGHLRAGHARTQNLPAFVAMSDPSRAAGCPRGTRRTGAPASCRASSRAPGLKPHRRPRSTISSAARRRGRRRAAGRQLDLLARLNRLTSSNRPGRTAELAARIESFELAYRMQTAAPGGAGPRAASRGDARSSTASTTGVRPLRPAVPDRPPAGRARRPLRADLLRRHGERAELGRPHRHRRQPPRLRRRDRPADRGAADRPQAAGPARLDAGDLGRRVRPAADVAAEGARRPAATTTRTPSPPGSPAAASRAASATAPPTSVGHKAVVDRVSVHDLHATLLHLMGLDHEKLTYLHNGRRYRLTDVHGKVIRSILA